jgi:hypothetical protein
VFRRSDVLAVCHYCPVLLLQVSGTYPLQEVMPGNEYTEERKSRSL